MNDFSAYLPDIIIAAAVVFFAVRGCRKGFVRSVVGIVSFAAALLLAWMLKPLAADLLGSMGVKTVITERIAGSLNGGQAGMTGTTGNLPRLMQDVVETGRRELINGLAGVTAGFITNIIAFIAVLIAARLIIWLASRLLGIMTKLPVIGTLNRAAGAAIGAFEGIALVYIVLAVIYAAAPLRTNPITEEKIEQSIITKQMYINNPIVSIMEYKTMEMQWEQAPHERIADKN